MKAILLSAGRGSRLLPLTESRPKCLLPVQETTLLGYQLNTLEAAGIRDVTVVTGFLPDLVEAELAGRSGPLKGSPFFNPFFQVADNLASCWMVRERMDDDFLLINGDTLFKLDLIEKVIAAPAAPILVTIDQKESYDLDDMKVTLSGTSLTAIGKTLLPSETDAESIGILRFKGSGPMFFRSKLEQMMRTQDGVQAWFLKAINAIASTEGGVETVLIKGHRWAEVDTVADFEGLKKNGF
ncbi:nucleotidyltransferase family protein [Hyphomonas polymorpha PS728]|uniref:Nucleotidyltransferase family protein n=1 Tax=Hyphomonas polymorpha PS728 TaxID=1280954 RepID=A0A062VIT1_9PROT|nr:MULTISPECIES: phosphocholine cytidylyltransferase family protein [Hyphomonas]AXE64011.1 nucleotidyltransferase [Hyphomonas sp. CACIAM 19H1]KCZ99440.1 nucleotidyltransferase family protein [Hyphomonas polymorpha PS728]